MQRGKGSPFKGDADPYNTKKRRNFEGSPFVSSPIDSNEEN